MHVHPHVIIPKPGLIESDLMKRNIPYRIIPIKSWASKQRHVTKLVGRSVLNVINTFRLMRVIFDWDIDIVYTNSSVIPVGAFAALLSRRAHIWHIREFGEEDYGLAFDWGAKVSRVVMSKFSDTIILISQSLEAKYRQIIPSAKMVVIYDAISLPTDTTYQEDKLNENDKNCVNLAIVGLVHPGKGQKDAILAVAELIRQGWKVTLDVVGDGDETYFGTLQELVNKYGIDDEVRFKAYVDNPYNIMCESDLILVCSRSEALGRVTVEANLLGKPVIGARSGATAELLKEGFNGLLYEPGNYKELAQKIALLMNEKNRMYELGQQGKSWAQHQFSFKKCAGEVLQVFESVHSKHHDTA